MTKIHMHGPHYNGFVYNNPFKFNKTKMSDEEECVTASGTC